LSKVIIDKNCGGRFKVSKHKHNNEIVTKFWMLFSEGKFDDAGKLMHADATVWWPNTREVFKGRDKFILANKKYPGRWLIAIEKNFSIDDTVISAVRVESEDKANSFYATSFFYLRENLIQEITEYWGMNEEPPKWRTEEALSEKY
jgi:hypothetical protein